MGTGTEMQQNEGLCGHWPCPVMMRVAFGGVITAVQAGRGTAGWCGGVSLGGWGLALHVSRKFGRGPVHSVCDPAARTSCWATAQIRRGPRPSEWPHRLCAQRERCDKFLSDRFRGLDGLLSIYKTHFCAGEGNCVTF